MSLNLSLLIDGYNVIAPVAPPGRSPDVHWLQRERMQLINRLQTHLDEETRQRTCVVFDAANPPADRPSRFEVGGIDVWFAVDYPEADDLLEELIAAHSAPKQLTVVSSDARVQTAARRRGSVPMESQPWLDDLLDGKVVLAHPPTPKISPGQGRGHSTEKPTTTSEQDVAKWLQEFGFDE